jgi:hypothetical protein
MQTPTGQEAPAQPPSRRLIMQIRWGPMAFRKVLLSPGQVLQVGRAQTVGLSLRHDLEMSNAHFELAWDGSEGRIRDLGSTAGTLLSGERIKEATVQDGDWIRAGSTDFSVYFEDTSPPPPSTEQDHKTAAMGLLSAQEHLFAVLDAARSSRVLGLLQQSAEEYRSLYEGHQGNALADVAPYLVRLPQDSSLLGALLAEGWGENWGIYLTCTSPFLELRRHLRKFLMVHAEGWENRMYFRFYDPRVLQAFLPTCTEDQLNNFFGPINCFFFPDPSQDIMSVARNSTIIVTESAASSSRTARGGAGILK